MCTVGGARRRIGDDIIAWCRRGSRMLATSALPCSSPCRARSTARSSSKLCDPFHDGRRSTIGEAVEEEEEEEEGEGEENMAC